MFERPKIARSSGHVTIQIS